MIPGNNPNNERFPGHTTTSVDTKALTRPAFASGRRRRLLIGGAIFLLISLAAGTLLAAKILAPFKQVAVRQGKGDAHKAQIVIREQYNALQIIPQVGPSGHPPVGVAMASAQPAPPSGAQAATPHPAAPSADHLPRPQPAVAPGHIPAVPKPTATPTPLAPREAVQTNGKVAGLLATRRPHAVPGRSEARVAATRPAHPPVVIARTTPSGRVRPLSPTARQVSAAALAQHQTSTAHQMLRLASIPVLPLDRPASLAHRVAVLPRKISPHPAALAAPRPTHAATPSHRAHPVAPHATLVARATPSVPPVPATGGTAIPKHPVLREEGDAALHAADHPARRKVAVSRQAHPPAQHLRPVRPVLADRGDAELPRHRHYADRLPADTEDEMDDDGPPPGYYAPPPRYYAPPPRYYGPPAYPGYMYRPPPPYYPGW